MPRQRRPNPFAVRLSAEQRADLEDRADRAGLSMGGYALSVIFNAPAPHRRPRPTVALELLAKIAAAVGHIGGNVNQLAYVANTGGWPDSRAIAEMQADIRWMRHHLTLALGMTPTDPAPPDPAP